MIKEKRDIKEIELEGFGLDKNLQNVHDGISRILKINENIIQENKELRNKIVDLELNINTLVNSNKKLINFLNRPESGNEVSNKKIVIKNKDIVEVVKKLLQFKDENINDDFVKHTLDFIIDIIEDKEHNIDHNEILELINLIYNTIDEDLLIEFTKHNADYMFELIGEKPIEQVSLLTKMIRILYSMEDFILTDDYMLLLDFNNLILSEKNEESIIELMLIYIHLLGCDSRKDIDNVWTRIGKADCTECIDAKNYLRVKEELNQEEYRGVSNLIEVFTNRLGYIDEIKKEVKCNIRLNAYTFMFRDLEKELKNKKIAEETQIQIVKAEEVKKIEKISLQEEYFDHKLYIIGAQENICPIDSSKLLKKTIVEKTYGTLDNMSSDRNPMYKEVNVYYCSKCNTYFIKDGGKSNINGFMKVETIKVSVIPISHYSDSDYNLSEKSPLRKLGYHTRLNNDARWNILRNTCIPELGKARVLFYLEGFVSRFSKQKTKDYSKSINIWNEDIRKIKRL